MALGKQLPFHPDVERAVGGVDDLHGSSMGEAGTRLAIDRY